MDGPLDLPPLVRAWAQARGQRPFTIPGHKRRAGALWPELGELLDSDVPLYGGLDTVKQSAGTLAAAEAAAARLWGGDWARFSTGGSTQANQAMTLAVGRPGDTVLVARNAHRSTLLGLVFAGLRPVWLPVGSDPRFGIPTGVEAPVLAAALERHPEARAVFLTEPAYLGVTSDLPALVHRAHARDVPVIVDQAWGAHLGFHPDYPSHALAAGADAMVTSAHKTLLGYSQAALMVARLDRLDRGRLERAVDAGHTTSPAGSILASIDASRLLLESAGPELLGRLNSTVSVARMVLRAVPGVQVPGPEDFPSGRCDPAKLVVQIAGTGVDGIAVEQALIEAGFPVEMADRDTLVPVVTVADSEKDVLEMAEVLAHGISDSPAGPPRTMTVGAWPIPEQSLPPREAFFADRESLPWTVAGGRVCAEVVAPYPPGVPVLMPGERIESATIDRLRDLAAQGTRVAYAADPTLNSIEVVVS